jgi:formate-dependent nitrite reductase cytochrome c552 subunit
VKFDNIPALCGSCHGPTFRDWEAGAHGRTSGFWNRTLGSASRLSCANCHDPHSPKIPTRQPAPGPHSLRENAEARHGVH